MKKHAPGHVAAGKTKPRDAWFLAAVAVFFLLSRIAYHFAGIRFYSWSDTHLMHFVAPELLRTHLLRSVFFLHNQPPLFNLFIGAVLKLPFSSETVFPLLYAGFGAALAVSLFLLMRNMGISPVIALVMTCLFIASPSCIFFENILLYTYPVVLMLCLAALALHRFAGRGGMTAAVAFFMLLAAVILTRSLFHAVWFGLLLLILIVFLRRERRKIFFASAVPILLVLALYSKNLVLFGSFSASSWMGMSLAKMITFELPEETRVELAQRGMVSELALLPPFNALWYYNRYVTIPSFPKTGIPVLDMDFFPGVGNNWNNLAYVSISRQYGRDAATIAAHYPFVYLRGLKNAVRIFFFPASDWFHSNPKFDIPAVAPVERLYNAIFHGQPSAFFSPVVRAATFEGYLRGASHMSVILIVGLLASLAYAVLKLRSAAARGEIGTSSAVVLAFLAVTILYVTVAGTALDVGENNRFRFNIDPFLIILWGMMIQDGIRKLGWLTGGPVLPGKRMRRPMGKEQAEHTAMNRTGTKPLPAG